MEPNQISRDAIVNLITTYHELNAAVIDELQEEPSPLEFMRYVAKNRPFVARRAANEWRACQKWNASYFREVMEDAMVEVAITPHGNADSVVWQDDSLPIFVEPHQEQERFVDFLSYVQNDSIEQAPVEGIRNVKYAQTQNDNLREEYQALFSDVPQDIPFARIALEKEADAINFWLGNQRSVTSLHKDNYENIYVQVLGQKHFVLLPPVEMPCVNEQSLPPAKYRPLDPEDNEDSPLTIKLYENAEPLPVATWDPDEPERRASPYSRLAKPLRMTLRPGDMLYLPAMWYHKVSQTCGDEDFACAVNYWYDIEFAGSFWANNGFLRDVLNKGAKGVEYPELVLEGWT